MPSYLPVSSIISIILKSLAFKLSLDAPVCLSQEPLNTVYQSISIGYIGWLMIYCGVMIVNCPILFEEFTVIRRVYGADGYQFYQ